MTRLHTEQNEQEKYRTNGQSDIAVALFKDSCKS